MHIRSSFAIGTLIVADATGETVGYLGEPLINPDTAKIEAFSAFTGQGRLLLPAYDISSWSMHVHVRDADVLGPPEDFIRLQNLINDERTVLHQPIIIESTKKKVGVCKDVQFDTRHFKLEWIFPMRWWFLEGRPLPVSDIVIVTKQSIIVRDPSRAEILALEEGRSTSIQGAIEPSASL